MISKPRIERFAPDRLTGDQLAVYMSITGGPRGRDGSAFQLVADDGTLNGPFNAMVAAPHVGAALDRLGAAIRYQSELPADVRELVILYVAQAWRCDFEWYAHSPIARDVGVPEQALDALRNGLCPADLEPPLACAYEVCAALHESRRVPERLYWRAHREFGTAGMVELVVVFGYYALLADVLATFEVGLPPGTEPVWPTGELVT